METTQFSEMVTNIFVIYVKDGQCDQTWRFVPILAIFGNFWRILATIFLPKIASLLKL